ncbi:sushi domain-containing protein 2 [Corythoichthys intestinalis]|uniref:sushi domain-containing protein 2 n=1 Tax=Corythoichthys intestinalis TaxID=161448 RepID=UPI0025A6080E|nr:sushi domain-containing protein 2 [Corythoichthys intestinalis]
MSNPFWLSVPLLFIILSNCDSGASCEGKCGQTLSECSCRPTCASLETCCSDYKEFCVEFSPHSGSILGGTNFLILHSTFNKSAHIVCKFDDDIATTGYVDESQRGHCISPLLYQTGWVSVQISSDGIVFNRHGSWLSVHTGKLNSKFKAVLVNSTKWQYYGTPQVGGTLEMTWNASQVRAQTVNIELWGYRETGNPYSDGWRAEWKYLYSLAKGSANNGSFAFVPRPSAEFSDWELGAIRVSSSTNQDGLQNVEAAWSEDHALAWHLEQKFRDNSQAWALDKCLAWDQLEMQLPNFLDEIIDCPCTLAQARADTGRFHTDYGCDMEKGSVCTYHPGSIHCVRAIQASPRYGAGQQCCYDSSGAQVLTADSIGGSTPDRAHDWGSPPYVHPPRVPGQSHWVYDVLSFYYCCLWSDNCHYYFKHRPSSDCRRYRPPSSAVVFGDPHFITFDGVGYSFNGKGEYILLTSPAKQLTIQGRTEPVHNSGKACKLSSVAMREASSDVMEVRLVAGDADLQVLQNQKRLVFTEQSWMDLNGVFVFSPSAANVTVMFPSGAGVEVRLREGTVTATVLLPEEFRNSTQGLLGNWNGVGGDDLIPAQGGAAANHSDAQEVFNFGASWAVSNTSTLFTYDSKYLLDTYSNSPGHDPNFIPTFSIPENPEDPLYNMSLDICSGNGSHFCRYDILVGRSPELGKASKVSFQSHVSLVQNLKPVVTCGWLAPPTNGEKDGTTYLQGATVRLVCNEGFARQGEAERTCQADGTWSGAGTVCVQCTSSNNAVVITLSVVAVLLLIGQIATGLVFWAKHRRRSRNSEDFHSSFGRIELTED